ncbi:hypothetical protein E3T55_11010 [Cryobacterium frigoriphilum]|uniref:Uncharacterized protein n=1 Tax=Cryobacterium frigoriphilum TaxID=1259150 RepID=A0A4R8ZZV6_9MICO|nr:hypothetical protein [Cryobacterium frigoriphilum]TFD49601.1 hypothetical protein E3T55_11010 [Cryobacterium frigoriphilum]
MSEAHMTFSVSSGQPPVITPDAPSISETVRVSRALQAALRSAEALASELDDLLQNLDEDSSHQAVADAMQLDADLVRNVREGQSSLTFLMKKYVRTADSLKR